MLPDSEAPRNGSAVFPSSCCHSACLDRRLYRARGKSRRQPELVVFGAAAPVGAVALEKAPRTGDPRGAGRVLGGVWISAGDAVCSSARRLMAVGPVWVFLSLRRTRTSGVSEHHVVAAAAEKAGCLAQQPHADGGRCRAARLSAH